MNTPDYNEFELLWKEQDLKLKKSVHLNEKLLKRLNTKQVSDDFLKLVRISLLGRNFAFVYFLVSAVFSFLTLNELKLSVPGMVGAAGMLGSFIYHMSYTMNLNANEYSSIPVIDFQKKINRFKIRAMAAAKYDLIILVAWILTLFPLIIAVFFEKDFYEYLAAERYWLVSFVLLLLYLPVNQKMYQRMYADRLTDAEKQLQEIIEFEKSITQDI
jgi:hypothetical protein